MRHPALIHPNKMGLRGNIAAYLIAQDGCFIQCMFLRIIGLRLLSQLVISFQMPSSVLNNQIPNSLVFYPRPLHYLPPRVFGCVCFVCNFKLHCDKLSFRSTRCIFLGYALHQKGYKCYDPSTHKSFVSADVTFFESQP